MKILFICTHNRCRSILSEAITNHLGDGRLSAFSAGSQPAGKVHPKSIHYLSHNGVSVQGLKSQSWDDFEHEDIDLVVTVCDSAAAESCPAWFGQQAKIHWQLEDPSKIEGDEALIAAAFQQCIEQIQRRTKALLALPFEDMGPEQLQLALNALIMQTH